MLKSTVSGVTCRIQVYRWDRSSCICLRHSLLTAVTSSAVETAGPDLCGGQRAKFTLGRTRPKDPLHRWICWIICKKMTSPCSRLQLAYKSSHRPSTVDLPDSHFRFNIMRSQTDFEIVVSWSVVADVVETDVWGSRASTELPNTRPRALPSTSNGGVANRGANQSIACDRDKKTQDGDHCTRTQTHLVHLHAHAVQSDNGQARDRRWVRRKRIWPLFSLLEGHMFDFSHVSQFKFYDQDRNRLVQPRLHGFVVQHHASCAAHHLKDASQWTLEEFKSTFV